MIWLTVALCPMRTPPHPEIVARFETFVSTSTDQRVPFRLYRPAERSQQPKPLLVWLHGLGEAGDNNRDQLAWLELLFENQPQHAPACFILALQRPSSAPGWLAADVNGMGALSQLDQLIEEVVQRHPIDLRRIYLAGISSGATGCWEMAKRYPDRFAAVVPLASTAVDMTRLDRLVDLPIWAFQSIGDGPATIRQVHELAKRLQQVGGRVHLTIIDSPTHDCWTSAFHAQDVGGWMLAQRQASFLAPPPGWQIWQFRGALLAITAVIALSTVAVRRRRWLRQ